jgi:putative molybdopterin biosynthesis protein
LGKEYFYLQIADSLRDDIFNGVFKPGDTFPPIRNLAKTWNCTNGTVQRAFQILADEGLVTTHVGKGTKVLGPISYHPVSPLRKANIIHKVETFLLEVLTEGYETNEVEDSFRIALERWKAVSGIQQELNQNTLLFSGSHDLAMAWLATHFNEISQGFRIQLKFTGSLSGLISLSEGKSDVAGAHLWDEKTESYNIPLIHSLFPGEKLALITLAHRRMGWLVRKDNPKGFNKEKDLTRKDIRFVNRNSGSGTRVFLDSLLRKNHIDSQTIQGYSIQKTTHSEIAAEISEGKADVGLGLEAAARAYDLDFIFVNRERYDLIVKPKTFERVPIQNLILWLKSDRFQQLLENLNGYDCSESGSVQWT